MLSKKQKIYFYSYLFSILLVPLFLYWIAELIPEPNLSNIPNPHPFQHIDDKKFFIGLILNLGIYLYPLHLFFINKVTLQIKKRLFILASTLCILIIPICYIFLNFSIKQYFFVLCYITLIFIFPFIIIYKIKYVLYKKGE